MPNMSEKFHRGVLSAYSVTSSDWRARSWPSLFRHSSGWVHTPPGRPRYWHTHHMYYINNIAGIIAAVLHFPVLRFPVPTFGPVQIPVVHFLDRTFGPAFSGPAFSSPDVWSYNFRSCTFRSRHFRVLYILVLLFRGAPGTLYRPPDRLRYWFRRLHCEHHRTQYCRWTESTKPPTDVYLHWIK